MNPPLKEQLKDWKQNHQESTPKKKKPNQNPQGLKLEHLIESEWKYIMGTNKATYHRHNGAVSQRKGRVIR